MKTGYDNLSSIDRASRMVLGFALIGIAYFSTGFLGALAALPLIAIVPMMTATLGYCPVESALARAAAQKKVQVSRTVSGRHVHGH